MPKAAFPGRWRRWMKWTAIFGVGLALLVVGGQYLIRGQSPAPGARPAGADAATQHTYEKWLRQAEDLSQADADTHAGPIYRWQDDQGNWQTSSRPREAVAESTAVVEATAVAASEPGPADAPEDRLGLADLPGIKALKAFADENAPAPEAAVPTMDREALKAQMEAARSILEAQRALLEQESAP